MKNLIILLTIFTILFSCNNDENSVNTVKKGKQITEFIAYDVPITKEDGSDLPEWLNNIEGDNRLSFQKQILKNAEKGKYTIYKDMDGTQAWKYDEFYAKETYPDSVIIETEFGDSLVVFENELKAENIVKIRFLEKWYFAKDKSGIQKEIIGFAPLTEVWWTNELGDLEMIGYRDLFWVRYDKEEMAQ